jgi:hypothetical protein
MIYRLSFHCAKLINMTPSSKYLFLNTFCLISWTYKSVLFNLIFKKVFNSGHLLYLASNRNKLYLLMLHSICN